MSTDPRIASYITLLILTFQAFGIVIASGHIRKMKKIANYITEEGWEGQFSREEAPGAMRNGSRVVLAVHSPGDPRKEGASGTVLGSAFIPKAWCPDGSTYFYFIEWDDTPRQACIIIDSRIKALFKTIQT